MEATKRTHGKTILKKVEETLDAELWGKLQDHIPLHVLYEKLSLNHRLRLRIVCKAWYYTSLQRLEPKPYFVTIAAGHSREPDGLYLNGLVKYDAASQKFSFKRQSLSPYRMDGYNFFPPFAVEGLIFFDKPGDECGVFSIHTKTWHRVPIAPELYYPISVCGMMVDTSERPYSFKLIMGSLERKTQIYDSRSCSWCTTSSVLSQTTQERYDKVGSFSCMCHNCCVYMSLGQEMVLVYSMEEDSWTTLNFPPLNKEGNHNTLGVWDGRIFTAGEIMRSFMFLCGSWSIRRSRSGLSMLAVQRTSFTGSCFLVLKCSQQWDWCQFSVKNMPWFITGSITTTEHLRL